MCWRVPFLLVGKMVGSHENPSIYSMVHLGTWGRALNSQTCQRKPSKIVSCPWWYPCCVKNKRPPKKTSKKRKEILWLPFQPSPKLVPQKSPPRGTGETSLSKSQGEPRKGVPVLRVPFVGWFKGTPKGTSQIYCVVF